MFSQHRNKSPALGLMLLIAAALLPSIQSFVVHNGGAVKLALKTSQMPQSTASLFPNSRQKTNYVAVTPKTRLFMYNLPPSGGGGGGKNDLVDIAKGALGLFLVIAFFASPLGGFVLGIFNSLLLLSIVTPILLTLGFQTWQYFNTIEAPCPNCSAPVKALKTNSDGESTPTICYNCGAIVQANYDNTAIDNVTGRNSMMDDDGSMFGNSIFDIFSGGPTTTTSTTKTIFEERAQKENRRKREQTIIDVEIEDDKPWQ